MLLWHIGECPAALKACKTMFKNLDRDRPSKGNCQDFGLETQV